jgi:hypothetical protein
MDEEAFDKEFMSWVCVNNNPHNSDMHYLFAPELLKKNGEEEGVGPSSGTREKKKKVQFPLESKEEEDHEPLEKKKRTLPMFPQLLKKSMLSGKDFNDILATAFIGDVSTKKPRTGISPVKILNPQPISMVVPRTRETYPAPQNLINIIDDLNKYATTYTIIITKKYSFPPQDTTFPYQSTLSEPMQLDLPGPPENVPKHTTLTTEALSQSVSPSVPIQVTLP